MTATLSGAALLVIQFLYPQAVTVPGFSSLLWLVVPASVASVLLFDFFLDTLLLRVLKSRGVGLPIIWAIEVIARSPFIALSLLVFARLLTGVDLAVGAALAAGFTGAFVRYYLGLWMGEASLSGEAAADLGEVPDAEEPS